MNRFADVFKIVTLIDSWMEIFITVSFITCHIILLYGIKYNILNNILLYNYRHILSGYRTRLSKPRWFNYTRIKYSVTSVLLLVSSSKLVSSAKEYISSSSSWTVCGIVIVLFSLVVADCVATMMQSLVTIDCYQQLTD